MQPDSALTRCPECQTVFSVDGEDLDRAGGRVRCGECLHVFDAIANALPGDETSQHTPQAETLTASAPEANTEAPPEEIDEPASHTATASSLSWTLLEPIDAAELETPEPDAAEDSTPEPAADKPPTTNTDATPAVEFEEPVEPAAEEYADISVGFVDATNEQPSDAAAVVSDEIEPIPVAAEEQPLDVTPVEEFRFGDDTPPEMLEAELDALLDDERAHTSSQNLSEVPELDLTTTMSDVGDADLFDNNWDDLLNELDETAESVAVTLIDDDSTETRPLDFELGDSDTTGLTSSVDLDLSRADAALSAPESIDAITLSANTDYRAAPDFDVFEPAQPDDGIGAEPTEPTATPEHNATDDSDADASAGLAEGNDIELSAEDEAELEAQAEAAHKAELEAEAEAAHKAELEAADVVAIDSADDIVLETEAAAPAVEETQPDAPTESALAQSHEEDPASAATPLHDPEIPEASDDSVKARVAAYHAALAASDGTAPTSESDNTDNDVSFDLNALTDMFSAADILASGAAAEANDAAPQDNDTPVTEASTETALQSAGDVDETDDAAVTTDTSGPTQTQISEDAAASVDSSDEERAEDTDEDREDTDAKLDRNDEAAVEIDVDALSEAMNAGEEGEVIILSGDPSELEPAADAFAESMILSPDLAPPPTRRRLWLGLSGAALLALCLQTIHGYRGDIATVQPWGGYLAGAYGLFGQTLTPHWNATQMCVERSGGALSAENQLDIETVFSNHGDKTMPMPVLKLRITDAYSDTLAGVVIEPAQYLPATDPRTELRPGEQATALATLDYSEPRLDGFEVSLCYAGDDGTLRCALRCEDDDAKR